MTEKNILQVKESRTCPRWIPPNHPSYCYFFWGTTGSWCELSFLASKWGSSHKWLPSPSAHRQPQENIKRRIPTCFRNRTCVHALPNIAAKRMFCIVLLYYVYKIVQEGSKTASLPHAESDLTPRPSHSNDTAVYLGRRLAAWQFPRWSQRDLEWVPRSAKHRLQSIPVLIRNAKICKASSLKPHP